MKSFTGKFTSGRGWALSIALLLGAGMMISACGDEEVPAPTTPAPPPPAPPPAPEPEPAPEPPATPTGLHVDAATASSITWHWNAVEGALGYAVQVSMDEMFDDTDQITLTQETSFTATPVPPETSVYLRVRAGTGTPEALAAALATGSLEGLVLSDWSTHVTGMTTAVPLAPAPANLEVKERGSDFIEWKWDAVEGVAGYQSQFSTTSTFPESSAGRAWHDADETTRKVSNLDAESDGYLRVRTYAGTQAEPTFGAWTAASMSTTSEPPPAVPLGAPEGLEASDIEEDSITLTWDEVDDADSYEVGQREPGGDWGAASCQGGDNVVDDEECVASDLTAGTDYDFRVRAVPSDTDKYETSDWSDIEETRTAGDAPPEPTDPTSGGMGMANVRWHNGGTNNARLTFVWDREGDALYETYILDPESADNPADIHDDNPCEDVADVDSADTPKYESRGSATSQDIATTGPGTVMGLCVRAEGSSEASFAWGISPPEEPNNGTPEVEKLKTTALEWTDVDVKEAFDYEVRLAADPERPAGDNKIRTSSGATSRAVQSACDAGALVDSFTPDIDLSDRTVTVESGLKPHTGYLLCIRASNTAGTGAWAVPITEDADPGYGSANSVAQEIFTRPAAPPSIRNAGSESTPAVDADNEKLAPAWEIGTRNAHNVPRNGADFNLMVYRQDQRKVDSMNAAACAEPPEGYGSFAPAMTDGLAGFEIEVQATNAIERWGYTRRVYLCAQANSGTADGKGPGAWTISSAFSVTKPSTSLALSTDATTLTDTAAQITIKGWNRAWWYKTNVADAPCVSVAADTENADLSGLTASTSYSVTAWDADTCVAATSTRLGSVSFRTKATP